MSGCDIISICLTAIFGIVGIYSLRVSLYMPALPVSLRLKNKDTEEYNTLINSCGVVVKNTSGHDVEILGLEKLDNQKWVMHKIFENKVILPAGATYNKCLIGNSKFNISPKVEYKFLFKKKHFGNYFYPMCSSEIFMIEEPICLGDECPYR